MEAYYREIRKLEEQLDDFKLHHILWRDKEKVKTGLHPGQGCIGSLPRCTLGLFDSTRRRAQTARWSTWRLSPKLLADGQWDKRREAMVIDNDRTHPFLDFLNHDILRGGKKRRPDSWLTERNPRLCTGVVESLAQVKPLQKLSAPSSLALAPV